MKTNIVRLGNSKCVIIPDPMLEAAGLSGEVEIEAAEGEIRIKPTRAPRAGWSAAASQMMAREPGALLDGVTSIKFDDSWEW